MLVVLGNWMTSLLWWVIVYVLGYVHGAGLYAFLKLFVNDVMGLSPSAFTAAKAAHIGNEQSENRGVAAAVGAATTSALLLPDGDAKDSGGSIPPTAVQDDNALIDRHFGSELRVMTAVGKRVLETLMPWAIQRFGPLLEDVEPSHDAQSRQRRQQPKTTVAAVTVPLPSTMQIEEVKDEVAPSNDDID